MIVDTGATIGIETRQRFYLHYTERGDLPNCNGVGGPTPTVGDGFTGYGITFEQGILGYAGYARNTPACNDIAIVSAAALVDAGMDITITYDRGVHVMRLSVQVNGVMWETRAIKRGGLYLLPLSEDADFGDYAAQPAWQMMPELRYKGVRVGARQQRNFYIFRVQRTSAA